MEVAFYHKPSRTLLVTDAVIYVPRKPPECISKESLLASAKNGLAVKILSKGKEVPDEPVVDNKRNRQKGIHLFPKFRHISYCFSYVVKFCLIVSIMLCRVGKNGSTNLVSWSIKSLRTKCDL